MSVHRYTHRAQLVAPLSACFRVFMSVSSASKSKRLVLGLLPGRNSVTPFLGHRAAARGPPPYGASRAPRGVLPGIPRISQDFLRFPRISRDFLCSYCSCSSSCSMFMFSSLFMLGIGRKSNENLEVVPRTYQERGRGVV